MSRLLVYLRGLHQPWLVLRTARDRASRHIITPLPTNLLMIVTWARFCFSLRCLFLLLLLPVCNDVWYPLPNSTLGNIPPLMLIAYCL